MLPDEAMCIKGAKPGEEPVQGVGYREEGTMVVEEGCRGRIGDNVDITITSVLQTSAGRMIFGRLDGAVATGERRRSKPGAG